MHAEIKRTWDEIQIISDISEKSSPNTLTGKEEFAFCGVSMQNVCPYRGSNLNYYII